MEARKTARRVCLFDFEPMADFHGYEIQTFDPVRYIDKRRRLALGDLIRGGLSNYLFRSRLYSAVEVDRLYRSRDPDYMRLLTDFVEKFKDFDLVILGNYNPIHPEILYHELKKPIKVLGFIDDPFSSYIRGVPYLWAFDGAFYISPSYDERWLFEEKIQQWGCGEHYWWPLRQERRPKPRADEAFFRNRDVDLVYIGRAYGDKTDRLVRLRRHFGKRFRIHGYWPFNGYYGVIRGLWGKPILWSRVPSLRRDERRDLYFRSKIGVNLHLSNVPRETGNMRMYEVPEHGAMLLCDKAGRDAHAQIFDPNREAVFYDSIDDAIEKAEHYLKKADDRVAIARAGFDRVWKDYEWGLRLKGLLDWASGLRKKSQ